ncbi:MAG: hypothetical protein R3A45_04545 [Bdellovibrionota bacterium]
MMTDQGVLSRNIYGLSYPAKDVKFGLLEASEGKIGNAIEKSFCIVTGMILNKEVMFFSP